MNNHGKFLSKLFSIVWLSNQLEKQQFIVSMFYMGGLEAQWVTLTSGPYLLFKLGMFSLVCMSLLWFFGLFSLLSEYMQVGMSV